MQNITIDLTKTDGKIKYMNGVNNGPLPPGGGVRKTCTNFDYYKELEISYARTHDSSFCQGYGGEHIVDVHRIFKNFEADENDPKSYVFEPTDQYIKNIIDAGTKVFYRLGASIEHHYKYGTKPPKDFLKWARICEHIIMHYNEGWADGFHYGIEYWEIWNEPDTDYKKGNSPTWGGTMEEFFEMFEITLYHLKGRFPNLKIGGPSLCSVTDSKDIFEDFLKFLTRDGKKAPLDFFSWHMYGNDVVEFEYKIKLVEEMLQKYGYDEIESILNEWNYVKGWTGDEYTYSCNVMKELKGSSFVAGAMCVGQALKLDKLMYYDARPNNAWNGIFSEKTYSPLKTYYVFEMFRDFLKFGNYVPTDYSADNIYTCMATDGINYGMLMTYFNDDEAAEVKEICLDFVNVKESVKVEYYLLDENHSNTLTREEIFTADKFKIYLKMRNYTTYYIKITGCDKMYID